MVEIYGLVLVPTNLELQSAALKAQMDIPAAALCYRCRY